MGHISTDGTTFDGGGIGDADSLGATIVEGVADANGVDPLDLRPLYTVVDQDALTALFRSGATGVVTFEYEECEVAVTADGAVSVDGDQV